MARSFFIYILLRTWSEKGTDCHFVLKDLKELKVAMMNIELVRQHRHQKHMDELSDYGWKHVNWIPFHTMISYSFNFHWNSSFVFIIGPMPCWKFLWIQLSCCSVHVSIHLQRRFLRIGSKEDKNKKVTKTFFRKNTCYAQNDMVHFLGPELILLNFFIILLALPVTIPDEEKKLTFYFHTLWCLKFLLF